MKEVTAFVIFAILLFGCASQQQVLQKSSIAIRTGRGTYGSGENISITLNPLNENVYILKNMLVEKAFGVYKLQDNEWVELKVDSHCGDMMFCVNGELAYPPCPVPLPPQCNKINNETTWVWDQKALQDVQESCGVLPYTGKELRQVGAGTYKIRVGYYNQSDCNGTQKYLETRFDIR